MINVTEHQGIAHHAAMTTRSMWTGPEDMADAKAGALLGLVQAGQSFDPEKNHRGMEGFARHAWLAARDGAQRAMAVARGPVTRHRSGRGETPPVVAEQMESAFAEDGGDWNLSMESYEAGAYTRSFEDQALAAIDYRRAVASITDQQLRIIELHHDGWTLEEIGQDLGMTKQGVAYHRNKALKTLREARA